jgi:folate-binding protein YgfZ
MTSDLAAAYELLTTRCAAVELPRDVVRVSGPDAVDYLQGQLSQDVAGLARGEAVWSFVLQPQGKVDAWVRVTRLEDDAFLLDVDGGSGPAVVERLRRFKLRTRADIEALPDRTIAIRGPAAPSVAGIPFAWPGFAGVDLIGTDPTTPEDIPIIDTAAYEVRRIEVGFPRMGAELTERTIPAEAGVVPVSVSFTKGCYTGQELVARIDSRGGHVPRRLVGVTASGAINPGATLDVGGRAVGTVTSAARHPAGHTVALAYVARDVEVPGLALIS